MGGVNATLLGVVLVAGAGQGAAVEEIRWEGRVRTVEVHADGGIAFALDGRVAFPFGCASADTDRVLVGIGPGDLAEQDLKGIDMMLETVRMAIGSKRDLIVVIDGCSANGRWYRLKSVRFDPRS